MSDPETCRIIGISTVFVFSSYYIITSVLQGSLHFIAFHQLEEEFERIGENYADYRLLLTPMHLANRIGLHASFILIVCGIVLFWEKSTTPLILSDYSVLIVLLLSIVFVFHFIPFYLGRLLSTRALIFFFPALKIQYYFFYPLVKTLAYTHRLLEFFGPDESSSRQRIEDDIMAVVSSGEQEGILEERDVEMIESIIEFKDEEVCTIMIPRTQMVAIDENTPLDEVIQLIQNTHISRYPVYRETRDNIIGILYAKDLFQYWKKEEAPPLAEIARKPYYIPESKRIGALLHEFAARKQLIAIVLDEFGGTAGIVTLTDILGRILGEILEEERSSPTTSIQTPYFPIAEKSANSF